MKADFYAGIGVGFIIAVIVNFFLIYGGFPMGANTKINNLKKEVALIKDHVCTDILVPDHRHDGMYGRTVR